MTGKYYKTKETVEEYIRLAQGVNGAILINKLNEFLSANSNLLELGTGPGADWEILSKTHTVTGSDNSKEFLAHLNSNYPEGRFLELDAITIEVDVEFDAIYSNKVLHHLSDEELKKSIKKQNEILTTSGLVCHSFWKGEGSEVFKGLFVNYHTETALRGFFEDFFDILYFESYAEFEEGDSLFIIGKRK